MTPQASKRTFTGIRRAIALVAFAVVIGAILAAAPSPTADYLMYAGSYTDTTAKGIYAWRFDSGKGALTPLGLVAESPYPAQIWAAPNGRFLYAANWQGSATSAGDTITAYAIDRQRGTLTFLNKVSCKGSRPNQVVVDPSGKMAIAVNYGSGSVAAFGIESDGRLAEAFYVDQHSGQPTSPSRQPGPRAHGVVFSSDSRFAYVADIGLDRVYSYGVDAGRRTMTPLDPPYITLTAGSGPRRLQLHPNGRFLYVNRETDSSVSVFEVRTGRLKEIQTLPTVPAGYTGTNTTAEIQIDREGKHLYVSNRGHDTIAVFAVSAATGLLTLVEHASAGGRTPRNFTLHQSGQFLVTSNQNTENIVVFRVDRTTGKLTPTGGEVSLANPGSLVFIKVG